MERHRPGAGDRLCGLPGRDDRGAGGHRAHLWEQIRDRRAFGRRDGALPTAAAAADVFKELLLEADVHSFLVDDFIQDQLDEALVELPYGLVLTNAQITDGIIEVVPQDWLKEQVAGVLDEVTPYLVGKTDTFSVTIPLDERATSAITVTEGWFLTSLEGGAYDYLLEEQIAPRPDRPNRPCAA